MLENVHEIAEKDFSTTVLAAENPVLIDFWASWCGPCKKLAPVLEELASELAGQLVVVKINAEENQELAGRFRIMSVPTLLLIKEGKEVIRLAGYQPKEELMERLERYL